MLNITIGTNTSRKQVITSPDTVLRKLLQDNGVNVGVGTIHIDGIPLQIGDLDKTLGELGVTNQAYIISVAKADNAQ